MIRGSVNRQTTNHGKINIGVTGYLLAIMDENRAQAYLQLINTLLTCPSGEELEILQANSDLLDAEFLQVCEVVAENLAEEGNENAADFLRNLVSQLGEFVGRNEENMDDSEAENPREYLEFLQELLEAEKSYSGLAGVYPILSQRQHLLNARFAEILQQEAQNLIADQEPKRITSIVAIIENLSIHLEQFPLGSRANNIEIAIVGYQIVLSHREPGSKKWAQTQSNLANAYSVRIKGDIADNMERAIFTYKEALKVRTREAFPKDWATTTKNLAGAYYNRVNGNQPDNIEQAIKLFKTALEILTCNNYPEEWAKTNNNLGEAYRHRNREDREENIEQAIKFYNAALEVYTKEDFPELWAETQNNLGEAYRERISGEREENIEQAIIFYNAALEVHTSDAFPEKWATTQNNLGSAYSIRIRGKEAENIEKRSHFLLLH